MWNPLTHLFTVFFLVYNGNSVFCVTKTWKPNADVENQQNWMNESYASNCRGIIFPEDLGSTCIMGINHIETQAIVFPRNGEILIHEGGSITFAEDNENCIHLKRLEYKYWTDPKNWIFEEVKNKAIPDVERLPCDHDDVVFPKGSTFGVFVFPFDTYVNSILLDGVHISDQEWEEILLRPRACQQFFHPSPYIPSRGNKRIKVLPGFCKEKSGCVCATWDYQDYQYYQPKTRREHRTPCFKPIRPVGNRRDFCGGVLHIIPEVDFDLQEFRKQLPHHDYVDVYASKVLKEERGVIQVVLTEKENFDGSSVIYTETMYSKFKEDSRQWKIKKVTMFVSGEPLGGRAMIRNTILYVFGTFLLTVIGFGLLYVIFIGPPPLPNWKFTTRIPFVDRLSTTVSRFPFARFKNRGDGELSLAESVLSLEKEFDNPLYGQSTQSTRSTPSTSTSTVQETLQKEQRKRQFTETTYENPVYFIEETKKAAEE